MNKKIILLLIAFVIGIFSYIPMKNVEAATTYNGEFISFSYSEGKPISVVVIDSNNRRVRHNIATDVLYVMNGRPTNASSFKSGLTIRLVKEGNQVTEIYGVQNIQSNTSSTAYQVNGIVTKIDPYGMYIQVKPDYDVEQQYYINRNTRFIKNSSVADLSMLYEGDRVKMKMPSQQTSTLAEVEIMGAGLLVENIYKGVLKTSDPYRNTITVTNGQPFENWMFGASVSTELSSFTYTNETTIYAGNLPIKKEDLRYYYDKEVYFVTTSQFNREIVKKIVVLQDYERTYYDDFKSVNTTYNYLSLSSIGNMYYHKGSILIRNGRLIEPNSLTSSGTAYVISDGQTRGNYAHVVNVTNDGLNAPNLASHNLYFGELAFVDSPNYLLEVRNAVVLSNNYWRSTDDLILSYSNGTSAKLNKNSQVMQLVPNMDLWEYESHYGYFYVKDGHVQALHLLDDSQEKSSRVLTGSISTVNASTSTTISLKNVSQWYNGGWIESNAVQNINLTQTLIIKNGRVMNANQLKTSDRVVLFTTPNLEAQILLVNE